MPFVQISIVEGFSDVEQRKLLTGVTDAVVAGLGIPKEDVSVVLQKVSADAWAAGGVPVSELRPAAP